MNIIIMVLALLSVTGLIVSVVYVVKYVKSNTENEFLRKQLTSQQEAFNKQLESAVQRIKLEAADTLHSGQQQLHAANEEQISNMLAPLKENIALMNKQMGENQKYQAEWTARLTESAENMVKATLKVGDDAQQLATALTGKAKMQGCWGESVLGQLLQKEGFRQGRDYDKESVNDEGTRPDYVLHMYYGGSRYDVIVDSKVSLTAYTEYKNATDPAVAAAAMDRHIKSIETHVNELSRKDYAAKVRKEHGGIDYVLMFMPIESALREAMDADATLWRRAYDKGVVIVSEQNIMLYVKVLQLTLHAYNRDVNDRKLLDAATNMINRTRMFYAGYIKMGKKLKEVCESYNQGVIKLKDEGPSIITSAEQVLQEGGRLKLNPDALTPDDTHLIDTAAISHAEQPTE